VHRLRAARFLLVMHLNTLNAQLNPICHLLALLEAHHILHVSRLRVELQYAIFGSQFVVKIKLLTKNYV
jgi:hypothetical protein